MMQLEGEGTDHTKRLISQLCKGTRYYQAFVTEIQYKKKEEAGHANKSQRKNRITK